VRQRVNLEKSPNFIADKAIQDKADAKAARQARAAARAAASA
jgi:hypothetical protein